MNFGKFSNNQNGSDRSHLIVNNSERFVSNLAKSTSEKQPLVYFKRSVNHILLLKAKVARLFLFGALLVVACSAFSQNQEDPFVVKEYPDGTKIKVRWSQVSSRPDAGTGRGGVPAIRAMAKGEENLPEEEAPASDTAPAKVPPPPAGSPDVKVMKVYPDGTQVVVPWSELGKSMDMGNTHGGPPKIMPYDPRGAGSSPQASPKQPSPGRLGTPVTQVNTAPPKKQPTAGSSSATRASVKPRPSKAMVETEVAGSSVSGGFPSTFSRGMGPSLQYGQAFQDYGPSTLRSGPLPKSAKAPPIYGLATGSDQEVTANLIGIAFLGKLDEVSPKGMSDVSGVRNSVPGLSSEAAKQIAAPYFGKRITMKDLDEVCRQVMAYFEEIQQPVVTAVVPEQEIRGGVVQILVVKGQMGKVRVDGNRYFKSENLQSDIRLQPGDDLDMGTLTDDVAWLNSNPFRQVDPSLAPGSQPGQTDVILNVKDRFPIRPFVSYDNFGIQSLGYNRFSAGFSACDIWTGFDQQLNYQYMSSGDFNSLVSNSGAYVASLPWHHNLSIFGAYSKANPDPINSFSQNGYFWQMSMRYNIPLPTLSALEGLDYRHQIYLGYDFKASDTNIFFLGAELPSTYNGLVGLYNISQFTLGYGFNLVDPLGSTAFETVLYGSPGGMTSNNTNTAFQQIDGGADAQYIYGKFSLSRLFRLPGDAAVMLSGQIQQADSNLMPSESFGIGGYDTVRGYDQRSANGDNAYLGNIEIRSPPISFWQIAGAGEALDQLIFLAFLDYGQVLQYSSDTTTSENWHLMSVGPGLRYNIGPYFNLRFDWGFQLQQAPPGTTGGVGGPAGSSQAVVSATLAY